MKKKITAIILILSIVASLFAMSSISSSAAATRTAPSNFKVSQESNGFGISWNQVAGAQYYCLYMGYNNTWQAWRIISASEYNNYYQKYGHYPIYDKTLYTQDVWHTPHTLNHGNAPKLIIGQKYCFQINSCSANGSNLGKWSSVVKQTYAPAATKLNGNFTTDKQLRIYWNKIPGADDYELLRWNPAKGAWNIIAYTKNCSYIDKAVPPGIWIYQIRGRAETVQGEIMYGKWSKTQPMNYFPPITDVQTYSYIQENSGKYVYSLNWDKNPSATFNVRLYRNKNDATPAEFFKTNYPGAAFERPYLYKWVWISYDEDKNAKRTVVELPVKYKR